MPSCRIRRFLEESILLSEYRDSVQAKQAEEAAFASMVWWLAGAFGVSPATSRIRLDQTGFTRLPDQAVKKSGLYDPVPVPAPVKRTARERRNEEVLADWEERRLDPEYIFPGHVNKPVKKKRRVRHAREKA